MGRRPCALNWGTPPARVLKSRILRQKRSRLVQAAVEPLLRRRRVRQEFRKTALLCIDAAGKEIRELSLRFDYRLS